jgi:hypothetical protein
MIESTQYTASLDTIAQALLSIHNENFKLVLNEPTGNFFYDPWKLKDEFQNTLWEKLLSSLPGPIGEARIITLEPGTNYSSHADIDDRWHLSLEGNQSYLIDLENNKMFETVQDGVWYIMNAGKLHTAANFGQIPRRQLVVRKLLTRNVLNDPIEIKLTRKQEAFDYRYQFDHTVSPWLNMANKNLLITDFSYSNDCITLKIEKTALDVLINILNGIFKADTL